MKSRNCNLELSLLPSTPHPREIIVETERGSPQEHQHLTIFYKGRVCAREVTEVQARAIIEAASREVEAKTPSGSEGTMAISPSLQSPQQLQSPTALSMKSSLRSFLQKRKDRIEAASPYRH